jgi:NAD+ kinase
MKNIAIFAKVHDPRCQDVALQLIAWLRGRGLIPLVEAHLARHIDFRETVITDIPDNTDLVVVLGGDGTLISVARLIGDREVPILGVNLGSLGFLTEITLDELCSSVDRYLSGDYRISERMMLHVAVVRNGLVIEEKRVLNDVVINKGALARIIDLETTINGNYLTTYKGDGLIISTPTGSTGYSLSANGPILYPLITINLKCINEDVFLTLDGQVGVELKCGDEIRIGKAQKRTRLIISSSRDYFEILRTKLKWGER